MNIEAVKALCQDPNTPIVFAASDEIEKLSHWVQLVLDAIGHSDAFVSDRSCLSDFVPMEDDEIVAWHAKTQANLGIKIPLRGTSIIELAKMVKAAKAH